MTFSKKYSHFDGIDIKGIYKDKTIACFATVMYQLCREQAPVYTIGSNPNPQIFARGKYSIAGSINFIQFDYEPFTTLALPKIDIILVGKNEFGYLTQMDLKDVQILFDGSPVNIDDIVAEQMYQFTAKSIIPWRAITEEDHTGQIYNEYTKRWSWL